MVFTWSITILNLFLFLRKIKLFKDTKYTKEIDKAVNQSEFISKYRKADKTCKAAFDLFKIIYAKFARNLALDDLGFGGVYIGGGIAPKNRDIFDSQFVKEFESNYMLSYVLKKIPVYLITNENIGLIGAGFAGTRLMKLS